MKIGEIAKITGLITGGFSIILMICGLIGFLIDDPFLGVRYYYNFFWFAKPFIMLGIFLMLVWIGLKDKKL